MLMRLLSSGLAAGVIAGVCVAAIQQVTTTPLILKAETYEQAAQGHSHASVRSSIVLVHAEVKAEASGEHPADWKPEDGWQRTLFTSLATVGTAVGFALMLLAVMLAVEAPITAETGLIWGAAGFVVSGLAPALGLAPDLPGAVEADLIQRQLWWVTTAGLTAAGLYGLWRLKSVGSKLGSLALMTLPHVWGAPQPISYSSTVPAELASRFTASSLAVQAILWVLAGALAGYFWVRQMPSQEPA